MEILSRAATRTIGKEIEHGKQYFVPAPTDPRIIMASVSGKKLFLTGENFHAGAVILLNGEEQKSKNDPQNPQTILIGKKAGKRVKEGDRLQVRNPNGSISAEFTFQAGLADSQSPNNVPNKSTTLTRTCRSIPALRRSKHENQNFVEKTSDRICSWLCFSGYPCIFG